MRRILILLLITTSAIAAEKGYLEQMIACEEKEEALVSDAYNAFVTLLAKRELPKEELRFPARLAQKRPSGFLISRAFYVTPNELRGFEILVPKDCVTEKEGVLISSTVLAVASEDSKQGIILLTLKRKSPTRR